MSKNKSDFNNRVRTCVSGSPKRQLNSNRFGPDFVIIRPKYNIPKKYFSTLKACLIFFKAVAPGTRTLDSN